MSGEATTDRHRQYLFPCVSTYYEEPLILSRGSGKYLYDEGGKQYLDFFSGILTVGLGHCHPEVTERVIQQLRTLQHCSTLYITTPLVDLAQKMAEIAPGRLERSFFTNSGTEANETALLLARMHTGHQEVVSLRHAYHGRSAVAMSLGGVGRWRLGGNPVPGVTHLPNPYCFRCPLNLTYPSCDLACASLLEDVIQTQTSGRIAAFIAEPIQGLGGVVTPPPEYFAIIRDIVKQYGGLFVSDEVQTGFGRTGEKMFGIEHWGVEPDILTCAKAIANGIPMGATVTTSEIAASLEGMTISTFGGNPVSCTAALATIEVIEKERLLHHVKEVGEYFVGRLRGLQEKHPLVGEVRGKGLLLGVELVGEKKAPHPKAAAAVFEEARRQGLLIGKSGFYGNVLRIAPPLVVDRSDVDEAIRILDRCLEQAATLPL